MSCEEKEDRAKARTAWGNIALPCPRWMLLALKGRQWSWKLWPLHTSQRRERGKKGKLKRRINSYISPRQTLCLGSKVKRAYNRDIFLLHLLIFSAGFCHSCLFEQFSVTFAQLVEASEMWGGEIFCKKIFFIWKISRLLKKYIFVWQIRSKISILLRRLFSIFSPPCVWSLKSTNLTETGWGDCGFDQISFN